MVKFSSPVPGFSLLLTRRRERARTLGSLTGSLEAKTDALVVAEASLAGRLLLGGSGEPAGMGTREWGGEEKEKKKGRQFFPLHRHRASQLSRKKRRNVSTSIIAPATRRYTHDAPAAD